MEISLANFTNKKAFSPISNKLNENNFSTWRYQALLTIQSISIEDHLYADKVLEQFTKDSIKKIQSESESFKTWKLQDLTLSSWIIALTIVNFQNKVISSTWFYEIWDKKGASALEYLA
ncbi:uncharacterized protein DS421_14g475180 [Arachis hypogaea]|nr:uncharacterized protein DS421_14g475180 [Arachis hypogaea]